VVFKNIYRRSPLSARFLALSKAKELQKKAVLLSRKAKVPKRKTLNAVITKLQTSSADTSKAAGFKKRCIGSFRPNGIKCNTSYVLKDALLQNCNFMLSFFFKSIAKKSLKKLKKSRLSKYGRRGSELKKFIMRPHVLNRNI